ncbi:spore coat U domain-containing protein [Limnobacter humi]|uniref:Spore coat U domain-containing protein n=1 Tax=Limnobacter humi TaxID=1778671 RepID=A0ABT1WHV4_9BURK|nr:spore coat U domain-containing protein [Limnobacter humi]MCQ8897100.1 spore coat U domain-containing protein [Limnobacter humi]
MATRAHHTTWQQTVAKLTALIAMLIGQSSMAATTTGTLNVSATVTDYCELGATTVSLNLGSYTPAADSTQNTVIQVRCTLGTTYNVGLGLGTYASGSTRRLRHATDNTVYMNYELYQSDGTTVWQAPGQAGVVSSTGTGASQNLTVVGKIPSAQWGVKQGSYSDSVVITVTFP